MAFAPGTGLVSRIHNKAHTGVVDTYFDKVTQAIMGKDTVGADPSPIGGQWCEWSLCENNKQYRTCECPAPAFGGGYCGGTNVQSCSGAPINGPLCGNGTCEGGESCQFCPSDCCPTIPSGDPVDGGWCGWSPCSAPCGGGTQTRGCGCPAPIFGGATCSGISSQACNTFACAICGDGVCDSARGEDCSCAADCPCPTGTLCFKGACVSDTSLPVDGGWCPPEPCSATCGPGTQVRACNCPAPLNGGALCAGPPLLTCTGGACICGNGVCDTLGGETCLSCAGDCGVCPCYPEDHPVTDTFCTGSVVLTHHDDGCGNTWDTSEACYYNNWCLRHPGSGTILPGSITPSAGCFDGTGTLYLPGNVIPSGSGTATCMSSTSPNSPSACQPPAPVCGNSVVETGESCDPPTTACTPPYGGSCTYCNSACQPVSLSGPTCGDGACNAGFENCSTCGDCACGGGQYCGGGACITPVCGANSCEPGENSTSCCTDCGCPGGLICMGTCGTYNAWCYRGSDWVGLTIPAPGAFGAPGCGHPTGPVYAPGATSPWGNGYAQCFSSTAGVGAGSCNAVCGDGYCSFGEDCSYCATDCGICGTPTGGPSGENTGGF